MQSAKTSRPSASVFPISTVSPFLLLNTSDGLYEVLLTKFSTKPIETVKLTFNFYLTTNWKAVNTETAPHLSKNMSLMPEAK